MLKTCIAVVLLFGGSLVTCGAQTRLDYSHQAPYRGSKLEGEVYLCTSDRVAEAGFYRDLGNSTVTESFEVHTQRNVTTWRITIRGNRADVVAFSGSTQTLEESEEFSVVYRGTTAVLLTRQNVVPSAVQTITIDPSNSSFVYSSQNVFSLRNRANIFVGSCRPYF